MESLEKYTPAKTREEDFVNLVRLELNDIKNTFFKIGFRLREANNNRYYKKLGFNSIEECAEALFGFKKTTTYDLMAVAGRFFDPKAPMTLAEPYKKFSQSQLVLFTNVRFSSKQFINMVDPKDTIEKLRKAKKYWDKCNRGHYGWSKIKGYFSCKTIDEFIEFIETRTEEGDSSLSALSEKDFKTLDKIINNNLLKKANEEFQTSGKEVPDVELSSENSGYPEKDTASVIEISENDYEDKDEIFRSCRDCRHYIRFANKFVLNHSINGEIVIEGVCSVRCNSVNIFFNPVYTPGGCCGCFEYL